MQFTQTDYRFHLVLKWILTGHIDLNATPIFNQSKLKHQRWSELDKIPPIGAEDLINELWPPTLARSTNYTRGCRSRDWSMDQHVTGQEVWDFAPTPGNWQVSIALRLIGICDSLRKGCQPQTTHELRTKNTRTYKAAFCGEASEMYRWYTLFGDNNACIINFNPHTRFVKNVVTHWQKLSQDNV